MEQMAVIQLPKEIKEAVFLHRLNRFVAEVHLDGRNVLAHVPSSGRMRELFYKGARVYVQPLPKREGRKTDYKLLLAEHQGSLVSVDSLLPNRLVRRALSMGSISGFTGYTNIRPESTFGQSRFDFFLAGPAGECYIEVKSVTLVEDGTAMFPDAPSTRGARHLEELAAARREGYRAAVLFVIQREDAICFSPNDSGDPEFGQALRQAARFGVENRAYLCKVDLNAVSMTKEIPVRL